MESEGGGGHSIDGAAAVILLLDTSTGLCKLTVVHDGDSSTSEWQADRDLARGLLEFIVTTLAQHERSLQDVRGIGLFRGPGSFTGLRIGAATMNTIAASENIPIVGAIGDTWQDRALERLRVGEDDRIVLPEYGRDARITQPRK